MLQHAKVWIILLSLAVMPLVLVSVLFLFKSSCDKKQNKKKTLATSAMQFWPLDVLHSHINIKLTLSCTV